MRKIHVGDDTDFGYTQKEEEEEETVRDIDELRTKLSIMNVMAEIVNHTNTRAKVVVRENLGTSLYFSSMTSDIFWLNKNSKRNERKGDSTIYYFNFDGE